MKTFTVVSTLVMSSIALTPTTALQASSKGLKLYLTVDTNPNDDVIINTYQHGDRVFTHDAVIHSGSNEVTLQYPGGLIDTGEFRICVRSNRLVIFDPHNPQLNNVVPHDHRVDSKKPLIAGLELRFLYHVFF
jgi:hypothetical protein